MSRCTATNGLRIFTSNSALTRHLKRCCVHAGEISVASANSDPRNLKVSTVTPKGCAASQRRDQTVLDEETTKHILSDLQCSRGRHRTGSYTSRGRHLKTFITCPYSAGKRVAVAVHGEAVPMPGASTH